MLPGSGSAHTRGVADIEALYLLVPLSLVAVGVAVLAFFRMSASGQFDDAEGPAWSVLMDDDRAPIAFVSAPLRTPSEPCAEQHDPHAPTRTDGPETLDTQEGPERSSHP